MLVTRNRKWIMNWLLVGVFMVLIQFLLGGITRLTGSGLSITEWDPIMGFLPPLTDQDWNIAFEKYKQSAQFKYMNQSFTLSDFKFIFFWEWMHRFWARLMGLVFLVPFIYFLSNRSFTNKAFLPFIGLFVLGALQGAIGWIMVQSGLRDTTLFVGHIELATHFIMATILMLYLLGLYLTVRHEEDPIRLPSKFRAASTFILVLALIQLFYGGLMAGLHGGTYAPTWPDINGSYFPLHLAQGWRYFMFFDPIGIHLIHRTLAYIIVILMLMLAGYLAAGSVYRKYLALPAGIIVLQLILGIATVLLSPKASFAKFGSFEITALMHQTVGLLFALAIFRVVYFCYVRDKN